MKKVGFAIALMVLVSVSCKKDDAVLINARIMNSTDATTDGCDWLLEVDNEVYCPSNLDDIYKVDNLSVVVSFNFTDRSATCGFGNSVGYPKIDITEINLP